MSRRCAFRFHDLPSVTGGRLYGVPRHSIAATLEGLRWNRLIWLTGDDGRNIIVYRDDARQIRCFFHHRLQLKDARILTAATELQAWLRTWFPHLHAPAASSEAA